MRLPLVFLIGILSAPLRAVTETEVARYYIQHGLAAQKVGDVASARAYLEVACGLPGEQRKVGCEAAGLLEIQQHERLQAIRYLDKACEEGSPAACQMLAKLDRNISWLQHQALEARGVLFNPPGGVTCRPSGATGWYCESRDPRFRSLFSFLFTHGHTTGRDPIADQAAQWDHARRFELNGMPAMEGRLRAAETTTFYTAVLTPEHELVSVLSVVHNGAIEAYGDVLESARRSLRPAGSDELDEIVLKGTRFQLTPGQILKLPFDFDIGSVYLPLPQAASYLRIRRATDRFDRTLLITRGTGPGWLLVHDSENRVREVLVFR